MPDVDQKYVFPIQIALAELCRDIFIYSVLFKYAITIELTCPCEENMRRWYSVNRLFIPFKNWSIVDLFAVEGET